MCFDVQSDRLPISHGATTRFAMLATKSRTAAINARMDELKASYEARKTRLEEARRLAKESVEATREALVP